MDSAVALGQRAAMARAQAIAHVPWLVVLRDWEGHELVQLAFGHAGTSPRATFEASAAFAIRASRSSGL